MGFLGGILGGGGGSNWQAGSTNIQTPTTVDQANQAYGQTQQGLQQQQAFLQALQAQNGIGNQSSVFNQLQGVANGTGPNPAQAALANATGANVANQAALMAGQRGASANAGLLARQAAQQGGAIQQNAAGQAAALQSQQSLGALGQLGGIAGQQVAQQGQAAQNYNQAAQGQQSNLLNSIGQQNTANVGMQSNINSTNASLQGINAQGQQGVLGGIAGGVGAAFGLAHGGEVPMMADGGMMPAPNFNVVAPPPALDMSQAVAMQPMIAPPKGPQSAVGKHLAGLSGTQQAGNVIGSALGSAISNMFSSNKPLSSAISPAANIQSNVMTGDPTLMAGNTMMAAHGGKVPAMLSPGEKVLSKDEANKVANGKENLKEAGKKVPGKAKVKGDDLKNDVVPAELEVGGFVIPNSIMESENADKKAAAFVRAHMSRKQAMSKGK